MNQTSDKLHGLILAGGRSLRMGRDKSQLIYHGKPQVEHAYDLLTPFCTNVFISTRQDQVCFKHLPQLQDNPEYTNIGPLAGILSAMTLYPNSAWLVFACDLPFATTKTFQYLISQRQPQKFATAFISSQDELPEPLCTIWEAKAMEGILKLIKEGIKCPRKILIKSNTFLITQQNSHWLDNVNTTEEYQQALKK